MSKELFVRWAKHSVVSVLLIEFFVHWLDSLEIVKALSIQWYVILIIVVLLTTWAVDD